MEGGAIFLDSDSDRCDAVKGPKAKRGKVMKGDSASVGEQVSQKKKLTDITNLHQQQQQQQRIQLANQLPKQQPAPLSAADISIDQLLMENAMLKKLIAHRNAIIESCKADIQKYQSNFQKLRKQNSELAMTNSHMLAELNSSRQKLRELQLELGSKNGLLKAMKLELMEKKNTSKSKNGNEINVNEVRASQNKMSDQSLQEDNKGDTKRKRVSRSKSSAPAITKQVKSTEKVDNQRYSLRRQSAGMKAEKSGPSGDFFEVDEVKFDILHMQENLANEEGPTTLGSKVPEEAKEDAESLGPTNSEQVPVKRNVEMKRHSLRRQSARFGPENPEPTEDFFEIDDAKFAISHVCDKVSEENCSTTSSVTSVHGNKENKACTFEPQEIRRSSVGRPLRRTVEKVQSYKEIPLNVKMRREF